MYIFHEEWGGDGLKIKGKPHRSAEREKEKFGLPTGKLFRPFLNMDDMANITDPNSGSPIQIQTTREIIVN